MEDNKLYVKIIEVAGFKTAIKGMRNPKDSWNLSDSFEEYDPNIGIKYNIGKNDMDLAQRLNSAGTPHNKFVRQTYVGLDIAMPRYWWSEFDTYKFNTKDSCSTMHTLFSKKKPLTLSQIIYDEEDEKDIINTINKINNIAEMYRGEKPTTKTKAQLKRRAKTLLPEGFVQLRTVSTNYAELRNVVTQRKNHELPEWAIFIKGLKELPYADELIFK